MKSTKFKTIKCPRCDREYLPAEIFYPKYFFGRPEDIVRDYSGKILSFTGDSMNFSENYICDECGAGFKVTARVNFDASIDESRDLNHDYAAVTPKKLALFEG